MSPRHPQEPEPENGNETSSKKLKTAVPLEPLSETEKQHAIQSFQTLLRFPTVSNTAPETGAYKDCASYIIQELKSLQVLDDIHILPESPNHSPVVVACWKGQESELKVILLNSHYDVVPAAPEDWTAAKPFDATIQQDKIYGRGTQDMKCVCVQYMEAIRKLALAGFQPQRSVYLSFVPDEEVGGSGMAAFLESNLYKSLPGIALALDEGLASTNDVYSVFYGERLPWWIDVTARGKTGHGSRFIEDTAVSQLLELANRAMAFREGQRQALGVDKHQNCTHAVAAAAKKKKKTLGDVTSLNITTLQAGVQVGNTFAYNCVPPVAKCSMDIRISPHTQPQQISDMLDTWCRECSPSNNDDAGLSWKYIEETGNDLQKHSTTSTDRTVNPWYGVFCDAMQDMGLRIDPQVFPAATDSRFLRALGIRALGFSPMRNTEILLHENDEYIPVETFLEGIQVYVGVIRALASQKGNI